MYSVPNLVYNYASAPDVTAPAKMQSTFFAPGSVTREGHIASLHLNREQELPVKLSTVASRVEDKGYAEGVVTNTKFGSFPHSTLIGVPWGCQVLASKVDTGTRGRANLGRNKKRKISAISTDAAIDGNESSEVKQATSAASGFIHVLPPTPESWTTSLPHRTQVVYTPDYSYILQRIRARPGSTLIEAGSGSGSFTHAAARAVFNGVKHITTTQPESGLVTKGRIFTFEYHAERQQKVAAEMKEHALESLVTSSHRDVYKDGFWIKSDDGHYLSPKADCIFLDLPAPWEALPLLTRDGTAEKPSVLDPDSTANICTFSPCIEQAQRTISLMRRLGWQDIEMVEIQHKRIDVRREYTGLEYEGMRSVNSSAASVDEALARLQDVEERSRDHHGEGSLKSQKASKPIQPNRQLDAAKIHWNQGRLIHRSEPELKTHTSYLVFAILPREWTDEDEKQAIAQAPKAQQLASSTSKAQKHNKQKKPQSNGARDKPTEATNGSSP